MKSFITKANASGGDDSGTATKWGANESNSVTNELKNATESTGQTPTAGQGADTDTEMLARSLTIAGQTAQLYTDGGVADAYVLTAVGNLKQPESYKNGMKVIFSTANGNTGASTINISALGSKKILLPSDIPLSGNEIVSIGFIEVIYDSSADTGTGAFILSNPSSGFRGQPGDIVILPYEPTSAQMASRRMLHADGSSVLDSDYPEILEAWSNVKMYGNVDGTHFNLPDFRGQFIRFWDDGAGTDPDAGTRTDRGDGTTGDNVGTLQDQFLPDHDHDVSTTAGLTLGSSNYRLTVPNTDGISSDIGTQDTRPTNIYVWGGIFY